LDSPHSTYQNQRSWISCIEKHSCGWTIKVKKYDNLDFLTWLATWLLCLLTNPTYNSSLLLHARRLIFLYKFWACPFACLGTVVNLGSRVPNFNTIGVGFERGLQNWCLELSAQWAARTGDVLQLLLGHGHLERGRTSMYFHSWAWVAHLVFLVLPKLFGFK
jgi:hypothetical protein